MDVRRSQTLVKRLKELGGDHTSNPSSRICLSDDLQYGLVGHIIYRLSTLNNDISITKVVEIESPDTFPPVQWILPYSTDRLILVGSQPLGIEEALALCGEPECSLGHEIDLTSQWEPDQRTLSCDICRQTRHSDACWRCSICTARETFDICIRCLQRGSWCKDHSHRLFSQKDGEKSICWRASHALQIVNIDGHHGQIKKAYKTRTPTQSIRKPVVDDSLGVLKWELDRFHDLTLDLATDEIEISTASATSEIAAARLPSPNDRNIATTQSTVKDRTTEVIEENVGNVSLDKLTSLRQNDTGANVDPTATLCNVCCGMISKSDLLTNATLWMQRPLELVLKHVRGDTAEDEPEKESGASTPSYLELETLPHHGSLCSIAMSIYDGCLLCSRMWQYIQADDKEEIRDHIRQLMRDDFYSSGNHSQQRKRLYNSVELVVDIKRLSSTTGKLKLRRRDSKIQEDDKSTSLMFGRVVESAAESKQVMRKRFAQLNQELSSTLRFTGWENSLVVARKWLSDCETLHHCSRSNDWLPTRLIDIGCPADLQSLRLHITTDEDKGKRYLTLSHRWGTSNGFKLTKSNIHQLMYGFAASDMPSTFRDAVEVCCRLGYRYLWIDSLCIIQDGDGGKDWMSESRLMAEVYRNSDCTIAALFSHDMHSGCFSARNIAAKIPILLESSNNVFLLPEDREEIIEDAGRHNLHSRAWVFQERILSPRTLGFSATGITWDCRETQYEETRPYEDRSKRKASNITRGQEMMDQITVRLFPSHVRDGDRQHFLKAWFELVDDYSGLQLSFQSDKLIALAGITQTIHQSSAFDYFYGLWYDPTNPEFFLSQLLWHTVGPEDIENLQQRAGRPPSFSWTSCNCRVDYPITFHDRVINDSAMSSTRKSGWSKAGHKYMQLLYRHKFLLISGGEGGNPWDRDIEFRSKLDYLLTPRNGLPPTAVLEGPIKEVEIRLRSQGNGLVWDYPWDTLPVEDKEDDSQRHRWFFPDAVMFPPRLTLLTIARWWRSWDRRWYVAGIALCKVSNVIRGNADGENVEMGLFSRVGYFEHSWVTQHEHWYDDGHIEMIAVV